MLASRQANADMRNMLLAAIVVVKELIAKFKKELEIFLADIINKSMREQILNIIRHKIGWYSLQNYHIFYGPEFIENHDQLLTENEKILFRNVSKIQRQCDNIAVELLIHSNHENRPEYTS